MIKLNEKKICTKCGIEKSLDDFYAERYHKDGKASWCKMCKEIAKKQWRESNLERIRKVYKEYRQRNKQKRNEYSKQWRESNAEKRKIYQKQWNSNNPEYFKQRLKNNPKYRISRNIGKAIWACLRNQKANKAWLSLVPYTLVDLIKHLKKTLPSGYIWQDFTDGRLHLDHKIPISAFNFTKPEHIDFKRCWALSNLQLLPVKINLEKASKLTKPFQPSLAL